MSRYDLITVAGLLALAAAGWLVAPALGVAVLGSALLAVGVTGSVREARRSKAGQAPGEG